MKTRQSFGNSLKEIRKARGFTQEDFAVVSSRTYVSALERGVKSPTLEKIEALCETMGVHPLTLLVLTYMHRSKRRESGTLLAHVERELAELRARE